MNDAGYRKRLATDLPKWLDSGWVTADGASAILASVSTERRMAFGLAGVIGTLGGLLLGLGVLAFIAANWDATPRHVRLILIAAAMVAATAAAFEFDRRKLRIFAEAGVLVSGLVFAGAIALVGQTYHLGGDFEGAIMRFEIGILGAALLAGSPTLNILGLVGAGYWVWFGASEMHLLLHWQSLVAILVGVAIATVQNAHYGRIVAVLAVIFWLAVTIVGHADLYDWTAMGATLLGVSVALALWALGAALASLKRGRLARLGDAILWPTLLALLVLLGIEQTLEIASAGEPQLLATVCGAIALALVLATVAYARRGLALLDLIAVTVIALGALTFALYVPDGDLQRRLAGGILVTIAALWAVYQGQSGTHRIGKAFGLAAFGIETIYLYVVTLGTMMNTALAFLGGGVLFIVLAAVLYQIDRRLTARRGPDDAAEPPPSPPPAPSTAPMSPAPPPLAMADDDGGADAYPVPPITDDSGDDDGDRR